MSTNHGPATASWQYVCKSLVTELLAFTPVRLQPPSGSQGVPTKQQVELAATLCKNFGQFPISFNEIHNQAWPRPCPAPGPLPLAQPLLIASACHDTYSSICGSLPFTRT